MSRHQILTVIVLLIAAILLAQIGSGAQKQVASIEELLDDLQSDDKNIADAAERELHNRINLLSKGLEKMVWANKVEKVEKDRIMQRKPLDRALSLLQRLDYQEFARRLMLNVSYFDHSAGGVTFIRGYPCATMLCKLGPTAAYGIISYLERPPAKADLSDEVIELFARVVVLVYPAQNGGLDEAKAMLARAKHRAKNKEHIERLDKKVREFFQEKPPPPARPNES